MKEIPAHLWISPVGLISMAPPGDGRDGAPTGDLVADYGECNYRGDWGWVVEAMWATPSVPVSVHMAVSIWYPLSILYPLKEG